MAKKNAPVLDTSKPIKVGISTEDKILYTVINIIMVLWMIIIIYPLIFIVSSSFSSGSEIAKGAVLLWPKAFTTVGYELVFAYKQVWTGFANAVFYTVVGTALNLVFTIMAAYPLARHNFQGRGIYMMIFMITTFFHGGVIPSYINITNLGLYDSRWSLILPTLITVQNMIIMRTFFRNSIPGELQEAASLDGCSDFRYLLQVVLPLSKAVISVILLYYAVAHWNVYYNALLYISTPSKYPLQLVLRNILIANEGKTDLTQLEGGAAETATVGKASETMRYALIVIATVPILVVYPFIQKYFEQGVMIGSVKG